MALPVPHRVAIHAVRRDRGYRDVVTRTGLCARPGCAATAGAWLTYDYAGQQVWLDDVGTPGDGNRWSLCLAHAERLRVPRGWIVQDRRIGPRPSAPARGDGGGAELSTLAG